MSRDYQYQPALMPNWIKEFADNHLEKEANPHDNIQNIFKMRNDLDAVEEKVSELRQRVGLDLLDNQKVAEEEEEKKIAQRIVQLTRLANYLDDTANFTLAEYVDEEIRKLAELEKVSAPDLEEWKNDWKAERFVKELKPSLVKDWRVDEDDDFYYLQALTVEPWSVHGFQPEGAEAEYTWKEVDKKSKKHDLDTTDLPSTDLEDIEFADDKKDKVPKILKKKERVKKLIDNVVKSRGGHISPAAILHMIEKTLQEDISDHTDEIKKYIKDQQKENKVNVKEDDENVGLTVLIVTDEPGDPNKEVFPIVPQF